jgi:rhodanese-related sulfurtransferase
MNNHSDALVLDLRTAADFKTGHIKGSRNVPLKEVSKELEKLSSYKDKPILVYCNSGSTATSAIRSLKNAGFEKINNLEGGIIAWKEANLPLSKK